MAKDTGGALTNVVLKKATVKSVALKKGELTIVVVAPADEANATISDLNELTAGSFRGTVTVKGRAQQLSLIPDHAPEGE